MTQTIISLTAFTIFSLLVSIISIFRYLKYRNFKNDIKLRKKQIISSIIGMILGIPVTLFFIYVIAVLLNS